MIVPLAGSYVTVNDPDACSRGLRCLCPLVRGHIDSLGAELILITAAHVTDTFAFDVLG